MTHVQQPPRSKVCGQACVAMLAGVPLDEAIAVCTGARRRQTSEHDVRRGLVALGHYLMPFARVADPARVPVLWPFQVGIARVRYGGRRHGYHWIVLRGSHLGAQVHDPGHLEPVLVDAYERHLRRVGGYVTSWARVVPMPKTGGATVCDASRSSFLGHPREPFAPNSTPKPGSDAGEAL